MPLFLGLVSLNGLPAARSLILIGLTFLAAAYFFRLPMPVQPLKAMSAIAILKGFDMFCIRSAAIWMGVIVLGLAWTGALERISRWFSKPIIKGIQLGVGLLLIKAGFSLLFSGATQAARLAVMARPHILAEQWAVLWFLVLPQLPLTLGNSIFATQDAAQDYFGPNRATAKRLAASIGVANLAAGLWGGMPVCHGSGGLTAHYRCGARSAWSTALTGALCLTLGLLCGDHATAVLRAIPSGVLALLLFYVGLCHAWLVRGLADWQGRTVAAAVGFLSLWTGSLALAMVCGLLLEATLAARLSQKSRPDPI